MDRIRRNSSRGGWNDKPWLAGERRNRGEEMTKTKKPTKRSIVQSVSKAMLYPFAPELYVVEMWCETHVNGYVHSFWAPTTSAQIERSALELQDLPDWRKKCPDDKFRISSYKRARIRNKRD